MIIHKNGFNYCTAEQMTIRLTDTAELDAAAKFAIGENSIAMMNELGYEESPTAIPMTMQPLRSYIPKTPLPYM